MSFRTNGSSDRLRGGVPIFLMRLHQAPPPHAPPNLPLHLLKRRTYTKCLMKWVLLGRTGINLLRLNLKVEWVSRV
ncbi:hypothetical protein FEM48_Zijuj12G0074100 [Ziziphus jujuba var. spinosa]|uniref:Uncharacterized protein n=1 Tax=Ziziphus jujuba var. spinosa TaxID=714518 RepID=A0A978UBY9_ZIZJJ|nr:hypothetical protein FEM48_Zijuj12G0074100 [Ziziphus jujuba var. spinosa]